MRFTSPAGRGVAAGLLGSVGLIATSTLVSAQGLLGIDGPSHAVRSFTGAKCDCPVLSPPEFLDEFDYIQPNACFTPKSFSDNSMVGGVAHDVVSGKTYITDGSTIAVYSAMPEYKILCHFPRPEGFGLLTGLSFGKQGGGHVEDGGNETLWVTDGFQFGEIEVPDCIWGCNFDEGIPRIIQTADFPDPWAGIATGISYDPKKGVLFFCTSTGNVLSLYPDGSSNIFSDWNAATPNGFQFCQLNMMLTGITVDRSYLTTGTVFVTDGSKYIRVNWGGFSANNPWTPSFAWKCDSCFDVPDGEISTHRISGLAYHLKCNTYGPGDGNVKIAANSEAYIGNENFGVFLSGGTPFSIGILVFGFEEKCPVGPGQGPIPIVVSPFAIVQANLVGPGGTLGYNVPLTDDFTMVGALGFFQYIVVDPWGATSATKGLACQIGCPN